MSKRHQHTWTDEETDALRELFPKGTHRWMAGQLNERFGLKLSKSAVVGRCFLIGLRKLTPDDYARCNAAGVKPRKAKSEVKKVRKKILGYEQVKVSRDGNDGKKLIDAFDKFSHDDHLGISFFDLENNHCRFPKGDGLSATYCGQPVLDGQSYCKRCYSICYTPPKSPEEKRNAA